MHIFQKISFLICKLPLGLCRLVLSCLQKYRAVDLSSRPPAPFQLIFEFGFEFDEIADFDDYFPSHHPPVTLPGFCSAHVAGGHCMKAVTVLCKHALPHLHKQKCKLISRHVSIFVCKMNDIFASLVLTPTGLYSHPHCRKATVGISTQVDQYLKILNNNMNMHLKINMYMRHKHEHRI